MMLDAGLISYLEDLSHLLLSEDEKARLTESLEKILNGMAKLGALELENIPERSHPFDNVNAFREDIVKHSFDRELILKNAPVKTDEMFIAPKTVE
ncbi:MAG: Asp-tRNA(Asn)/Glu-tRNA(Gln) amidotransferase subunit GatC [Oscillospiraceae bacterium]|nr:Asp-tRNA(Asn)/Glu-tRNA(Gln) amidotransferase subunit GatC [Oscillospiraceae bacterium]